MRYRDYADIYLHTHYPSFVFCRKEGEDEGEHEDDEAEYLILFHPVVSPDALSVLKREC